MNAGKRGRQIERETEREKYRVRQRNIDRETPERDI